MAPGLPPHKGAAERKSVGAERLEREAQTVKNLDAQQLLPRSRRRLIIAQRRAPQFALDDLCSFL